MQFHGRREHGKHVEQINPALLRTLLVDFHLRSERRTAGCRVLAEHWNSHAYHMK